MRARLSRAQGAELRAWQYLEAVIIRGEAPRRADPDVQQILAGMVAGAFANAYQAAGMDAGQASGRVRRLITDSAALLEQVAAGERRGQHV